MNYPSIRIEGAILSPDVLDNLEDKSGQKPRDFGFDPSIKIKDEIARAWADANDYWRIFQRKIEKLKEGSSATTETRQNWIVPLFGLLGYELEYSAKGIVLDGKNYQISHYATNRGNTPVQIVGYLDPAGLDRKPEQANRRMSSHALVQEFLNLNDQLYGLATNGRLLRLLRDSSRLIKLSYLEFDLDRIFTDGLFADFAILYRLLHASRLPIENATAAESIMEHYHQDSLDSGARIRDGLSKAVEQAILDFANGFISNQSNSNLREAILSGRLKSDEYYRYLLQLIYRLLFLMVIEERDLIFPHNTKTENRNIYSSYYSLQRLRRLSEKRYLLDRRKHDLWTSLCSTFRLFEAYGPGEKLGIAPLAGDLFNPDAIGMLGKCNLGNDVLLGCLRALSMYENPKTRQIIRVNYAALNVEEFGSVYEGLLEYKPEFISIEGQIEFSFVQGDQRAATGSHYTPDELVQPLIKHSLDYLIAEKLKEPNPEQALLSLRVADISCGSGHILLAAARRIGLELATVRTKEDQPSPTALRKAIRDVIRECIYGVDLNPLAVELCKVALWLEAHSPGEPLNFLDHHIKCGNAIVGFAGYDDLKNGIPDEAFIAIPGDEKPVASAFRKRNKAEREKHLTGMLPLRIEVKTHLDSLCSLRKKFAALPERTPHEIEIKKNNFNELNKNIDAWTLNQIAAIPIAQFYLHKTEANKVNLITDALFRKYLKGELRLQGQATAAAWAMAFQKKFFHWFLEFPEIMEKGGFDCILGNPPYLGGQALSGTYGYQFCGYVRHAFAPTGLSDLVVYFLRRIYSLLKPGGFTAFITTNSIKDGDVRKDGLEQVVTQGGSINFAIRGIKWPGRAKLVVSLISLYRGRWDRKYVLDGREVPIITPYLEDSEDIGSPKNLSTNANKIYQGSIFLGDGFLLTHQEAHQIIQDDHSNKEVIQRIINGQELNNTPDQEPGRSIINFRDWSESSARKYVSAFSIIESKVRPAREAQSDPGGREFWWRFLRPRTELYAKIINTNRCFIAARTTKYLSFSASSTDRVFSDALYVFSTDRWDLFSIVQSTIHEIWARKYSGALETRLRYSPSDCFETFAFPRGLWTNQSPPLWTIGEQYHSHRRNLMLSLWIGLTDIYNLFHSREVENDIKKLYITRSKKDPHGHNIPTRYRQNVLSTTPQDALAGILKLRQLHIELDKSVLEAYGWGDLPLSHGFKEIETLPENDRLRHTICPEARKEILKRLLIENHRQAKVQGSEQPATKKAVKKKSSLDGTGQIKMKI
jgi:type I restriction-modification system DNA methylase subunit